MGEFVRPSYTVVSLRGTPLPFSRKVFKIKDMILKYSGIRT